MSHPPPAASSHPALADTARLAELDATGLLRAVGAPAQPTLDGLTRLAARLLGVPTALVSLVDAGGQYFPSCVGLAEPWASARGTPLSHSVCQHVVAGASPLVVEDLRAHPLLRDSMAIPDLGVVAYAGMPLRTAAGHVLGSFCVIDGQPRRWSADDLDTLQELACAAAAEIERHIVTRRLSEHAITLASQSQAMAGLLDGAMHSQTALQASEQEYRALLASLPLIVYRVEPHAPYAPLYVSPGVAALGYTLDEWLAAPDTWLRILHADDRARVLAATEAALTTGVAVDYEYRVLARDGSVRWIHDRGDFVRDANGAPVAWQGIMLDVTAQRVAEDALRTSEARFRAMFEGAAVGVTVVDDAGTLLQVNEAFAAFLGYTPEELVGRHAPDLSPPEDATLTRAPVAALRAGEQPSVTAEKRFRRRDGEIRLARLTISRLALGDGREGILGITLDITERRRAQQALERERAFLSATLESLSDGVVACDATGKLTLFNRASRDLHGLAAEPLVSDAWASHYSLYHGDGTTPLLPADIPLVRAFDGEQVRDAAMVIAPTGRPPRQILASGQPIRSADGETLGAVVAMRDVTAQVAAEAAVRESAARLDLIYNSATDLFLLMRVERDAARAGVVYRCESVNEAYLRVTGLTREALIGRTLPEILPPEAAAYTRSRYEETMRSGRVQCYDETVTLPGGLLVVETTLTPVLDDAGQCTHLLGVARDVTGTRRAEAALREREARFRGVLEHLRAPAVQLDASGHITFANAALLGLTEWSHADAIGADWFAHFVPNGAIARALFQESVRTGVVPIHHQGELLTRHGARRTVAWDHVALRDADDAVVGIASVGQDITERQALERRLAALSEHDELTGLLNRRGFNRMATHALKSAHRSRRHDAVLYIDLDRFKPINDTHGHAAGDDALRAVADLLRTTLRDADFGARLGGDEFAVFAVGLHAGEGHVIAARLRASLDAHNAAATAAGRPFRIEFSVGVAEVEPGDELEALLARADGMLYAQKLARRADPIVRGA